MKTTKTICKYCNKEFEKRNADYNRTEKLKGNHFCSRSCCTSYSNKKYSRGNIKHFGEKIGKKTRTKLSPFKYFIKMAKLRQNKYGDYDITLEYLCELWEKQNGICPYTKLKMILPETSQSNRKSLYCASLDRIDPSKGYLKNNVQFVTQFINLGKNNYTSKEVYSFLNDVKKNNIDFLKNKNIECIY